MSLEETVSLLARIKREIPPWMRILRIQRDIPVKLIEDGVRKSHLRELVMARLEDDGARCRCIRCREIGHVPNRTEAKDESGVELRSLRYAASEGSEHFLSFEIPSLDALVGYARLRLPGTSDGCAGLVRELHVYGQMVPISDKPGKNWQHRGYGERLLAECERIASDAGFREVWVTSGVGARDYYRRLGYSLKGPYMAKVMDSS